MNATFSSFLSDVYWRESQAALGKESSLVTYRAEHCSGRSFFVAMDLSDSEEMPPLSLHTETSFVLIRRSGEERVERKLRRSQINADRLSLMFTVSCIIFFLCCIYLVERALFIYLRIYCSFVLCH